MFLLPKVGSTNHSLDISHSILFAIQSIQSKFNQHVMFVFNLTDFRKEVQILQLVNPLLSCYWKLSILETVKFQHYDSDCGWNLKVFFLFQLESKGRSFALKSWFQNDRNLFWLLLVPKRVGILSLLHTGGQERAAFLLSLSCMLVRIPNRHQGLFHTTQFRMLSHARFLPIRSDEMQFIWRIMTSMIVFFFFFFLFGNRIPFHVSGESFCTGFHVNTNPVFSYLCNCVAS